MFAYGRKTFIGAIRCSIASCKGLECLLQSFGKYFIRLKHILRRWKNQTTKSSQKKLQNTTINLPSYIFRVHTLILLASFFHSFCQLYEQGKRNIVSVFRLLETDVREQKQYEMRTQTSWDNIVNKLRYEIKFENCVKYKNHVFIKRDIPFHF